MENEKKTVKPIYVKINNIQKEIGVIEKDSTNPFHNSKYFDINKLVEKLNPLLAKENLAIIQPLSYLPSEYQGVLINKPALETTIIDLDNGDQITYSTPLPIDPNPQKMGSAITYFRRYAIQALFFLQAEDDDAQKAVPKPKKSYAPSSPQVPTNQAPPYPPDPQYIPTASPTPATAKQCPVCGKTHSGKYPKCWDCYKAEQANK